MTNENSNKKRDVWDIFGTVSLFLSSVVIGGAGLLINSSFNERESQRARELQNEQQRLAKVQTLSAFMTPLSGNKESREAALFAITALGYPELVLRLNQLRKEDQATSDAIMRTAPASIAAQSATAIPRPMPTDKEIGWAYLGDYASPSNTWHTRYLDFGEQDKPDGLRDKTFGVRRETGSINVRYGMPTDSGEFLKVVKILKPGEKLRILEVRQWLTTGYTWARVAHSE